MSEPAKFLATTQIVTLTEDLYDATKTTKLASAGDTIVLITQTIADAVVVSNGVSLKEKLSAIDTNLASIATAFSRNQIIDVTLENCGVITGLALTKSGTVSRKLSVAKGTIFKNGRKYSVAAQSNSVSIPANSTSASATVIIYASVVNGVVSVSATGLNGSAPSGSIEIGRATVPANNTASNDAYLSNVTVTDTARREPGWPNVQLTAGQKYVALSTIMPNANYMVDIEVVSATSFHQLGQVAATNKTVNGFLLVTTGTADQIQCKCHVKYTSL